MADAYLKWNSWAQIKLALLYAVFEYSSENWHSNEHMPGPGCVTSVTFGRMDEKEEYRIRAEQEAARDRRFGRVPPRVLILCGLPGSGKVY